MPADLDESIVVVAYDPRWISWYESDAAELRQALGHRLQALEHFGSTAVAALISKPIIDILVAPVQWPLSERDRVASVLWAAAVQSATSEAVLAAELPVRWTDDASAWHVDAARQPVRASFKGRLEHTIARVYKYTYASHAGLFAR